MRGATTAAIVIIALQGVPTEATTCVSPKRFSVRQLCGLVADLSGATVPSAKVSVTKKGEKEAIIETTTDAKGNFEITNSLPRGEYELRVNHNGFAYAWQPVQFSGSKKTEGCAKPIVVELEPAGGCSGVHRPGSKAARELLRKAGL